VLKTLSFQAETHVNPLFAALGHFQKCGGAITKTAPVTFLDLCIGFQVGPHLCGHQVLE
jgi:hypothetical protein